MSGIDRRLLFGLAAVSGAGLAACAGPDANKAPAAATAAGGAGGLRRARSSKQVRAGWAPYPPYAEADPRTKQPKGFYIDLFNVAAKEAGLAVTWVETTWTNMIADLGAGRFDVMAAPTFRTPTRALQVAFTRSIDYFGLSAVARRGGLSVANPVDLDRADLTIAVTQGEVGHEYALRRLPKAKLSVFNSPNISTALVDVLQSRAQVGVADAWTIRQFVDAHPGELVDLFGAKPFGRVGAGWFCASGDTEFVTFLDTVIDWLESDGLIADAAARYTLASSLGIK